MDRMSVPKLYHTSDTAYQTYALIIVFFYYYYLFIFLDFKGAFNSVVTNILLAFNPILTSHISGD